MGRPCIYCTKEEKIKARNLRENIRRHRNWEETQRKRREYSEKNKEEIKKKWQDWYAKNKQKHIDNNNNWRRENLEKSRESHKLGERRRKTCDTYRFIVNIRSLLLASFKRVSKGYNKILGTEKLLGCSIEEFRVHILSKCPQGTTLKDFGRYGYHIDHIIPISTAKTEEDIIKLCHYTNLQPLWWKENLQKSNKINIILT